jgi:very-short-patch-repair endonuclease
MYDRSPASDAARAAWLETRGFRVIRFTPDDIRERLDVVLSTISGELAASARVSAARGPGSFRGRPARRHRPMEQGP